MAVLLAVLAGTVRAGENKEQAPPQTPDIVPENIIRQRFLIAYQTAQTAESKADVVKMLRGLKEKESLRLIAGMLGDTREVVRMSACMVMLGTPDPEGYFVKPLMGILTDVSVPMRVAAAEALATARMRADAVKALTFGLMEVVGQSGNENDQTALIRAYDAALERLTRQHCVKRDARGLSSFWMDYWKLNEKTLRAEDSKQAADESKPRPDGLEPDTFDRKDKLPPVEKKEGVKLE